MIIHVKVGNFVCRFSHDNFIDIAKCASIDLFFVWYVSSVSRQVVLVEGSPVGQETASIGGRDRLEECVGVSAS